MPRTTSIKFVLYLDSKHGRYYCYDPECCATDKGRQGWGAVSYAHCFSLQIERCDSAWYQAPEGVRVNPLCGCDFERTVMFHAKDPEVQCKGCMTCRKVTPTFIKRVEKQVV